MNQLKVATIGVDSYHIIFAIIAINKSHMRVVIIGANNNISTNKCTTTNRGIGSTIINYEHNK